MYANIQRKRCFLEKVEPYYGAQNEAYKMS